MEPHNLIPLELAEGLPHANIIRYVVRRYLAMPDNDEKLYFRELSAEVARLPGHTLDKKQIKYLVAATIAGVRARLYKSCFFTETESPAEVESAKELLKSLLGRGDPRLWPFLLIFEPVQTIMLLRCIAGIVPSAPPRGWWFRQGSLASFAGDHLRERSNGSNGSSAIVNQ